MIDIPYLLPSFVQPVKELLHCSILLMGNRGEYGSSRPEAPQPAKEQDESAEPNFQGRLALHALTRHAEKSLTSKHIKEKKENKSTRGSMYKWGF